MPYTEVRLETTREHAAALEALLLDQGALSVTFQDRADHPIYEPPLTGDMPLWPTLTITGLFDTDAILRPLIELLTAFKSTQRIHDFSQKAVKDEQWERTCLKDFHPIQAGSRLWICPSWETPPQPGAINVNLDPGVAFGTGTHATTLLCLEWLDKHITTQHEIIDYGCGSGILAISALLLGAKHVTAIDHDPQAIESTKENADKNHLGPDRLTVALPGQVSCPPASADVIIANILANPLIQLASFFAQSLKNGGQLVLSGILVNQAEAVLNAYKPWFLLEQYAQKDEWVCLTGIRLFNDFQRNI